MIDYFKKMKKRWKKYFSFSTLKTRDYQAGYAILMIGTLVIDYYKRGPFHMPITLEAMLDMTIVYFIMGILADWIALWKKRKKDPDDNV